MIRRLLVLGLLALVAPLALSAAPAVAVDCNTVTLTDSDGFDWKFNDSADVSAQNHDGFSNAGTLYLESDQDNTYGPPLAGECSFEDADREVVFPAQPLAGLELSSKEFVPTTGTAFVRQLWFLKNTAGAPRTMRAYIDSNVNYSADVDRTSSGDGDVTTGDDWLTFFDPGDASVPTSAYVWQGGGPRRVSAASLFDACCQATEDPIIDGFGSAELRYQDFDIPPGDTVVLAQFRLARATKDAAAEAAAALAAGGEGAFAGMSDDELRALRNFLLPDHDRDGVANEVDNCLYVPNGDQANADGDAEGNACDGDDDNDGIADGDEAARGTDPLKADTDGDGRGDRDDRCPVTKSASPDGCPLADVQRAVDRFLGRLAPGSVTAKLSGKGKRLTITGSILPPAGPDKAQACGDRGFVRAAAKRGKRKAGSRRARLKPDCTFTLKLRVRGRKGQRIKISVRWLGNRFLEPKAVRSFTRRIG